MHCRILARVVASYSMFVQLTGSVDSANLVLIIRIGTWNVHGAGATKGVGKPFFQETSTTQTIVGGMQYGSSRRSCQPEQGSWQASGQD